MTTEAQLQNHSGFVVGLPNRLLVKGKRTPESLEEIAAWLDSLPPAAVPVPAMCDRHAEELDRELTRHFAGALVSPYLVVAVLVFQVAAADPDLVERCDNLAQLGRLFSLQGCPSCQYPRGFRQAMRVVRRRGLAFGDQLTKGEATSANWRPDLYALERR